MKTTPWPVKIIRSKNRVKTISAELKDGVLVVRAPARMSDRELQPHIDRFVARLTKRKAKGNSPLSDHALEQMAQAINREYFQGKLAWQSIRYVTNQNKRFGSCTPSLGAIRISHRVGSMPNWVLRYVLVHELAHLLQPNHSKQFWELVNRYPLTERARGYLMAVGLEDIEV